MKIAIINPINATTDTPASFSKLLGLSYNSSIKNDIETSIVELGLAFVQFGHDVTIFISDQYIPEITSYNNKITINYLPTILKIIFPPAFIPFMPSLYKYIKKGRFDVILTVDFFQFGTILAILANINRKSKIFVWQDLNNYPRFPGGLLIKIFNKSIGRLFQRGILGFIPKTNSSAKFLLDSGIKKDKLLAKIPTGVNTNIFFPIIDKNSFNFYNIVTIARLHEQKGLKYLILAMKEVIKDFPNTKLLIKGRGPQFSELIELIKKESLCNSITIDTSYSSREDLVSLYNNCSIIVVPSIFETIGFVLLEGMACGKPIIASNINGPNEIVIHNKTGFLFESKNQFELAKYIIYCLQNKNTLNKMGILARELVIYHYEWNVIAKQFLKQFSINGC